MVRKSRLLCGATLLAAFPVVGYAQQAAKPQVQTDSGQLDDIVVTAQRREQNLQNVPIAISAFGAAALQKAGVTSTSDLSNVVPGLLISKTGPAVTPFLRGVGSSAQNPGNDPSVATYVDGVYQAVPYSLIFSLVDVERIEVLKGPQGTLFGRNATGGLINIVTKDPKADLGAEVRLGYGNFNTVDAAAYITGGSEQIAASFSVMYKNQMNGWGRNIATPADAGVQLVGGVPTAVPPPKYSKAGFLKEFGVSGKIKATLSDQTTIKLTARYFENHGDIGEYRRGLYGSKNTANAGASFYVFTGAFWDEASDVSYEYRQKQWNFSGEIAQELPFAMLKSITSYTDFTSLNAIPSDSTPQVQQTNTNKTHLPVHSFTQEFQLLSNNTGSRFSWIAGLFYLKSDSAYGPTRLARGALEGSLEIQAKQDSTSKAAFAQIGYEVFDDTTLTGGLRYTKDNFRAYQQFTGLRTTPTPVASFVIGTLSQVVPNQKTSSDAWTYKVSLDHRFSPEVLAYASYSRGYKAGGFNLGGMCLSAAVTPGGLCAAANIAPPVKPESLDDYEVGLKTDLFDRRVRLNLSAFHYRYSDLQIQATVGTPPVPILLNAAKARINGAELEGQAVAGKFDLNFTVSLIDAKYTSFPNATVFIPTPVTGIGLVQQIPAPDVSGNRLSRAPKFSSTLGFGYHIPASFGEVLVTGNWYYNSGFYWEPKNRLRESSYNIFNGQIQFSFAKSLRLELWGKNLSNKKYYAYQKVGSEGDQGSPASPRTYGATLRYSF